MGGSRIKQEVEERLDPFQSAVVRLCTIPGVDRVTAWGLLAEIGLNMSQFADARQDPQRESLYFAHDEAPRSRTDGPANPIPHGSCGTGKTGPPLLN